MSDDLNAEYRRYVGTIKELVAARRQHYDEVGQCSAAPFCIGTLGRKAAEERAERYPGFYSDMTLVAVGELSDAWARLEAQRAATESEMRRAEEAEIRANLAEERLKDVQARAEHLQGELDAYEEAEDILRGVEVIGEPADPE